MAQLISVRLQRSDNAPWGFRLQGGKDFGAPLVIQKVNGNSIAERAGLQAGDAVLRVNSTDVFSLRHKEAQDTIVRAGQNFEITIQRGSQTWKPTVIPTGNLPAPSPTFNNVNVTKTSLAASKPQSQLIGSGHNTPAKPFQNGNSDHSKLVNKIYNSPIGLYSEESIAETLSAQTEVLPTGALGVNFKKNERSYDANKSEVLKLLQEAEAEPRDHEPESERELVGVVSSPAPVNVAGLRHVTAPITPPASTPSANKPLAPGQNICADCERLIIGVFVRIKDKNLHVECFKCSTCGSSLKNVGYYNINNKLYCDIHAKLAARSNQPAPNMVPITIPGNTISAALQSHPLPAPLSPAASLSSGPLPPYSPCSSVLSGPRPFSSNAAPLSPLSPISAPNNNYAATLPRAQPAQGQTVEIISSCTNSVVEQSETTCTSSEQSETVESRTPSIVWPPYKTTEGAPTACPLYIPPSPSNPVLVKPFKPLLYNVQPDEPEEPQEPEEEPEVPPPTVPRMSICSVEISGINARAKTPIQCVEHVTETLDTQMLVDSLKEQYNRPPSPPPPGLYEKGSKQKLDKVPETTEEEQVEQVCERQTQELKQKSEQVTQEVIQKSAQVTQEMKQKSAQVTQEMKQIFAQSQEIKQISAQEIKQKSAQICVQSSNITNPVLKEWKSPMVSALTTASSSTFSSLPKPITPMCSVLTIAPERPFTPVQNTPGGIIPLPEQTKPYLPADFSTKPTPKPPEKYDPSSRMIDALTVASLRPFTPVTKEIIAQQDDLIKDLPPPPYPDIDLLGALTTAPERPFTPTWSCANEEEIPPPPPLPKGKPQPPPPPFEPKFTPVFPKIVKAETIKPPTSQAAQPPVKDFPPVTEELKSSFKPITEFGASRVIEADGVEQKVQTQQAPKPQQAQTVVIPEARKAEQVCMQTEQVCKQIEQICRQTEQVCQQLVQASKQTEQVCKQNEQVCAKVEPICKQQVQSVCGQVCEQVCSRPQQVCTKSEPIKRVCGQVCEQICKKTGEVCKQSGQVCMQNNQMICKQTGQICNQTGQVCNQTGQVCNQTGQVCKQLEQLVQKPEPVYQQSGQVCTKTEQVYMQSKQSQQVCKKTEQVTKQSEQVSEQVCLRKTEQSVQQSSRDTLKASRQFAGLHEPKAIPSYQKELMAKAAPKSQTPAKVEHYLEKVGTVKIQSEQFLLHAPDDIAEYQRSISPAGLHNRRASPTTGYKFTDFAAEQEVMDLLTEEFFTDKGQKRVRQLMTRTPTEEILAQEYAAKVEQERKIQEKKAAEERARLAKERKVKEEQARLEQEKIAAQPKPMWKPIAAPSAFQPITSAFQPVQPQPQPIITKPVTTVQPEVVQQQPVVTKIPVTTVQQDQIPKVAFQPVDYRPARSITPSLINSPAPIVPYYQMNLIPTEHDGPESFLYDPKSPDVSRAPTPKFDRSKSPLVRSNSPLPPRCRTPNPAGPPPNPLRAPKITETPATRPTDSFVAKHALDHQQKKHVQFQERDLAAAEFTEKIKQANLRATQQPIANLRPTTQQSAPQFTERISSQTGNVRATAATTHQSTPQYAEKINTQTANLRATSATAEQSTTQLGAFTQVQRKKVVTEEYERSQKQVDIERQTKVSMKPPSSPIRQVQSARGLKTYETSTGKPVQIPAGAPSPIASNIVKSDACAIPPLVEPPTVPLPDPAGNGTKPVGVKGKQAGAVGIAPRRGRGILNKAAVGSARIPLCGQCNSYVRGPFITALGKIWCPDHFMCATPSCRRPLQDLGFVEERGQLYCEYCFEQYLAPSCDNCHNKVKGDCLKAIGKHYHPECFNCGYCGKLFGNNPFFLEDGLPYCEADWNELFTTKCFACGFPVEAGDRWVEALSNNYHSQCFNCTMCKKNLEGQSFYAKGGRPFCKNHAR